MYDLRILLIWLILGFIFYLIVHKPIEAKTNEVESGEMILNDNFALPYPIPLKSEDTALANQLREMKFLPRIKPGEILSQGVAHNLLPDEMIISREVFPVKVECDRIMLAMVNPFDMETVDEIREILDREIEPVEISRKDFRFVIKCLNGF